MVTLVSWLLLVIAGLLAIPTMFFVLEIFAAIGLSRLQPRLELNSNDRPTISVLVPAHNESLGLAETLADIRRQLSTHDRLLVVADNCSDDTAVVARAAGAEVVERTDATKRGKGYALDWGIRYLSKKPTEIVVIVDADCQLNDGALNQLALTCARTARPTQALYLMLAPTEFSN